MDFLYKIGIIESIKVQLLQIKEQYIIISYGTFNAFVRHFNDILKLLDKVKAVFIGTVLSCKDIIGCHLQITSVKSIVHLIANEVKKLLKN